MPDRPTFTLTAVVSADGFIARQPGEHPGGWASAEEQSRFLAEVPRYDWAFMGRITHETAFRKDRRRVVFSRRSEGIAWREATHLWVNPAQTTLADVLAELEPVRLPGRCIVLGGTTVHDWFLARDLIDRVELTVEPLRFGRGLPLVTSQRGDAVAALTRRGFEITEQHDMNARGTALLVLERDR